MHTLNNMPQWTPEDSLAFDLGFHILSRNEKELVLVPARAIFEVPEDAPNTVCIYGDRVEAYFEDDYLEVQMSDETSLYMQLHGWARRYAEAEKALGRKRTYKHQGLGLAA